MLKDGTIRQQTPTIHPVREEFRIGHVHYKVTDFGGHEIARKIWTDYFDKAQGIVFFVDAMDKFRFSEVKRELDNLLIDERLADIPILILGNKIDLQGSANEDTMRKQLGLFDTSGKEGNPVEKGRRPLEIFMCSVVRRQGYGDGFKWLSNYL